MVPVTLARAATDPTACEARRGSDPRSDHAARRRTDTRPVATRPPLRKRWSRAGGQEEDDRLWLGLGLVRRSAQPPVCSAALSSRLLRRQRRLDRLALRANLPRRKEMTRPIKTLQLTSHSALRSACGTVWRPGQALRASCRGAVARS